MVAWLNSRRLRRRALLRWVLLVLPLAFLVSRIWSVDGLSTLVLFCLVVCIAILPFLLIHIFLGLRFHRSKTSSSTSPMLVPVESVKAEVLNARTKASTQSHTNPDTKLESKADTQSRTKSDSKADTKADAQPQAKAVTRSDTRSDTKTDTKSDTKSDTRSDTKPEHGSVEGAAGIDLDATWFSPEDLQLQIEAVGNVVQTHDLSDDGSVRKDRGRKSATLATRARPDQSSVVETSLIIATSHADTAELSALTHTEATQLVKTLQKDKTRLHRLVIAQQAAMDSERRAHDRSRLVARDAIKIMRDSREAQKTAEKLARREHSERKRLEREYRKVSTALDNAKSIIASRDNETV